MYIHKEDSNIKQISCTFCGSGHIFYDSYFENKTECQSCSCGAKVLASGDCYKK